MTRFLIKLGQKRGFDREAFAVMSGGVGIVCNICLAIFKFFVGKLSGSISITADALNNLSDVASNTVTIAGAKLSKKPVDKEHPFGHGRMEYLSALAVSALILIMGFELAKDSIGKIIHPQELKFSMVYVLILSASILVKLWMAYFNHRLFKHTDNINLKAVRQDSLNDCISTLATIVALTLSHLFNIAWIDGVIGLAVAIIILIGGINIASLSNDKIPNLRRCMGIVFQDYKLLQNMSVYDNVAYVIRTLGISSREINARVTGALKIVGLYNKMHATPAELSGGEQQRVGIARAIVNGPPLLIADEPTGNLDPKNSMEIMQILEQINQRGITVIVSTHDSAMVDYFRKRVITLDKGEVVRDIQAGTYE